MDLELLRTFLEVNRVRHFGRAAEALHLTQAGVSAPIRQLETLLGVRLFNRERRAVQLTPEGHRLARHAERLMADWRAARQDVTLGGAEAQLSLGGGLRLWDVLLQEWLHRVRRRWPDLALIAQSATPEVLMRRLLDGTLDLAFTLEPAQYESLYIEPVTEIPLCMVSTLPGLDADTALARDDYVMVDWGLAHALEHRRLFPDAPEPRTWLGQARVALDYLLTLGGSAILPLTLVGGALGDGRLHRVADAPEMQRTAHAVYPVRSHRKELIRALLRQFDPTVRELIGAAGSQDPESS